jgi:hypothetical protein
VHKNVLKQRPVFGMSEHWAGQKDAVIKPVLPAP